MTPGCAGATPTARSSPPARSAPGKQRSGSGNWRQKCADSEANPLRERRDGARRPRAANPRVPEVRRPGRVGGEKDVQLGYCTNVHAGVGLDQTRANLERYALAVKRRFSP